MLALARCIVVGSGHNQKQRAAASDPATLNTGHDPAMLIQPTVHASTRATPNTRRRLTIGPIESERRKATIAAWQRGEVPQPKQARAQPRQDPVLLRRVAFPTGLPTGTGQAYARMVWAFLCSCLRRNSTDRRVFWSNEKIARATGLSIRQVERAIAYLVKHGLIAVTYGVRPRLRKAYGRIIEVQLAGDGPNPRVTFPKQAMVESIWRLGRLVRAKPAMLVNTIIALCIYGAADGEDLAEVTSIHVPLSDIRAMMGACAGSTFNRRLDDAERAGLISRVGKHWREGITLHPFGRPSGEREIRPRFQPRRPAPPQLRRFARVPHESRLITLEDLDAMAAEESAAPSWSPPQDERPWWWDEPRAC
jgi:hypothetical protein